MPSPEIIQRAQEIRLVPISEVRVNEKNRNTHPDDQIERLCNIIQDQGFRDPLIISNRSGLLVSGHGRMIAAQRLGMKELPAIFQDFDSEESEYAAGISLNAISSWSELDLSGIHKDLGDLTPFDIDLLGIKGFEFEPVNLVPGCDEDAIPEHVEPRTKRGDIFRLGRHRLMCADSTVITDVEALIGTDKVDMIYTDPPYGVDAVGGDKAVGGDGTFLGGGKIVKANRYEPVIGDLSKDAAKDAVSLAMGLGIKHQVWWGANNYAHALPESNGWLYWQKNQTGDFADGELAWTSSKGSIKRFEHTWAGLIKSSEHGQKRCHPTQKPVALAEWCFETYAPETEVILDLFGGSGSTLIACEKSGRDCFMSEIDPHYCDVIVARWEKFTGKKAELVSG